MARFHLTLPGTPKKEHTVVYTFVSRHNYIDSGLSENTGAALNCSALALAERLYHFQKIKLEQIRAKEATEQGNCTFSFKNSSESFPVVFCGKNSQRTFL